MKLGENRVKKSDIRVKRTILILAHYCYSCTTTRPEIFEGVVRETGRVDWPVIFGYHIGHCPHCGLKLPLKWGEK